MNDKSKFELASQDRVSSLETEIDLILQELNCEGALVTDESEIGDFLDVFTDNLEKEVILKELQNNLGIDIMDKCELIVDIAQRMKDKKV